MTSFAPGATGVCLEWLCTAAGFAFALVFLWSTFVLLLGLLVRGRIHPKASRRLRFAVLVCARDEERVIRRPVESVLASDYPAGSREVIVLADNCADATAARARDAGATVWEKASPSSCKGDVLEWGVARLLSERKGDFDAIAVFDADNVASPDWLGAMNDALNDGEMLCTGRRISSNAASCTIAGWYAVYWDVMNEFSNRTRTNLGFSGKLTGTGFAFRTGLLGEKGWHTTTLVEDVEFSVQANLAGCRVAYVKDAEYLDEQPVTAVHMWRQLCRWATGCTQVAIRYSRKWISAMFRRPSLRLFDSFFAILTGMSMSFFLFFALAGASIGAVRGEIWDSGGLVGSFFGFFALAGVFVALASVALSAKEHRPGMISIWTFPVFSLILASTVLWTLVFPARKWRRIPHKGLP